MSIPYASGKNAIGFCDRCNWRYKLGQLKTEYVGGRKTSVLVCPTCWDDDHPQNWQGRVPVFDPQALRDPRPDPSMAASRVLNPNPVPVVEPPIGPPEHNP
jgi:hypothetical protein